MKFDRPHKLMTFLSALPLAIGSGFAASVLDSSYIGEIVGSAPTYTPYQLLIQAGVSVLLGTVVIFSLFWVLRRRGRGAKRLMIAFIVSPILYFVSVFLGESFLLILFKGASNVFQGAIMVVSLGVAMMSLALILMDAIPPLVKNIFVAFYGSIFGIFLGITMVTSTMFVLVVTLVIEDFFLTRYSPVAEAAAMSGRIGDDPFDYTRIQSQSVTVGVGDYVAFSLISAHAFVFFPWFVWLMSMILGLAGIIINVTILAKEDEILPAIPLPAILAILPWIIHIVGLLALGA